MKTIAIFGAGSHTKVIIDLILELNQHTIIGIYDDNKEGSFEDISIIGKIDGNVNCFNGRYQTSISKGRF